MAPEQSWSGWAVGNTLLLFLLTLGLMFSPIKKLASRGIYPDYRFVSIEPVQKRADELYSKFKDDTKLVQDVFQDIKDSLSSPRDLTILIHYLVKTKRATTFELQTLTGERLEGVKVTLNFRFFSYFHSLRVEM
jgi:hypothetical protein